MNPGGAVLILAGVWICCQVFGGKALERLGLVQGDPVSDTPKILAPGPLTPAQPGGGNPGSGGSGGLPGAGGW